MRLLLSILLYLPVCAAAQPDPSYIGKFNKNNVMELFPGVYRNSFNFEGSRNRHPSFRMLANSSAYLGTFINYKWATLHYSFSVPGTQLDKYTALNYKAFNLRFMMPSTLILPYFNAFNGLLIPGNRKHNYLPIKDIRTFSAGTDLYFYPNAKYYSYGAANYFSQQQLRSAGSIVMRLCPQWQQMQWYHPSTSLTRDSNTVRLLASNPQWSSLSGSLGYAYTFAFLRGRWTLSPTLLAGKGLIHEHRVQAPAFQTASTLQAFVNAGYTNSQYYIYLNAFTDRLRSRLLFRDLQQKKTDLSLTFGYRFRSMRKPILGII